MVARDTIMAQVSVYPLGHVSIGPTIREVVRILERCGLHVRVGEMSKLVWGAEETLFQGLQAAFRCAADKGNAVMCVMLPNACPQPGGAAPKTTGAEPVSAAEQDRGPKRG